MKRTKITDLLKSDACGADVDVCGWVRTRRGSKQVTFIALNDGTTIHNLQVVADIEKLGEENLKQVTTGSCIRISRKLVPSQGQGQHVEVQADRIELLGAADPNSWLLRKSTEPSVLSPFLPIMKMKKACSMYSPFRSVWKHS